MKSILITIALNLLLSSFAHPAAYNFSLIAQPDALISSIGFDPAINNSGQLVFLGSTVTLVTTTGIEITSPAIFLGGIGLTPSILYVEGQGESQELVNFSQPRISDSGTVAFAAFRTVEETGVFTGTGGPLTTIAFTPNDGIEFIEAPTINSSDTVQFGGFVGGVPAIFTGDGTTLTTVADTSGPYQSFENGDINDSGAVVFRGNLDAGGRGIYTDSGLTIADQSEILLNIIGDPVWNNSGMAIFESFLDSGDRAVIMGDGGPLSVVVDSSGPFRSFVPAINNIGDIAFLATFDPLHPEASAIFTGPDMINHRVIGSGDTLDGKIVSSVGMGQKSLNNKKQIAFRAAFTDGSEGIYVATVIPVPAAVWLFGSALGLLAWIRRRAT